MSEEGNDVILSFPVPFYCSTSHYPPSCVFNINQCSVLCNLVISIIFFVTPPIKILLVPGCKFSMVMAQSDVHSSCRVRILLCVRSPLLRLFFFLGQMIFAYNWRNEFLYALVFSLTAGMTGKLVFVRHADVSEKCLQFSRLGVKWFSRYEVSN